MLTVKTILPLVRTAPKKPVLFGPGQIADEALQTARQKICGTCQYNVSGICRQCCGGVPIPTLIKLTASRCPRHFW